MNRMPMQGLRVDHAKVPVLQAPVLARALYAHAELDPHHTPVPTLETFD